jgi:GT2 family glycosyltransferase
VVEGRLTGIVDGAITGWVMAEAGVEAAWLEAAAEGETPFGRTRAEPDDDGRASFAIPIPDAYLDGRMRFFDVRPLGGMRPLDGGPIAFDGGLLSALELAPAEDGARSAEPPAVILGFVRFEPPAAVEGWAFAPSEPERRLGIEILAGERLIAQVTADRPHSDASGDGRHGFRVDLARLLRYGPHEITIRAAGASAPLPGGRFRTGVFAADGEVDCPGYLDSAGDRALLRRLPFEHQARAALRMEPSRLAPRLINRLRRERIAFGQDAGAAILLVSLPETDDLTRAAWAVQSYPAASSIEAGSGAEAIRAAAAGMDFVLFAGPGDLLHPSAAGLLAAMQDAEVVGWPRFCADAARAGSPGTLLRRPAFDSMTVRHGPVSDTTLAVRGRILAEAPGAVLQALAEGRVHPLWVWLTTRKLRHLSHPEALTSKVGDWSPPSRDELSRDEALCGELLAGETETFALARTAPDLPMPWVLVPAARARRTSVIVPFRGRPELTLRCIHALAGQRLSGELELVLVDNQSEPDEARRILDGARRMLGAERVTALAYDAPFNHSAENNLGAQVASGEVLVICNNDVVLKDPALLEQLGAWALQPGVATVGCRLEDPERGLGSYGHVFSPPSEDPFQPPLRESPDAAYGRFVHAVPGNTLALAAVRRELYLGLGGLDSEHFPIGHNDSDFMLRASRQDLVHLYLGHLAADHRRGSSRTGDDEDLQALRLGQSYAETARGHLFQLARVRIGPVQAEPPAAAAPSPQDAALVERLEDVLERQAEAERRRADLAGALADAQALIARLQSGIAGD